MKPSNDQPERTAERELFRRLADQRLSPQEFSALEQRLLGDHDFRARYVQYMDLEASLYDELMATTSVSEPPAPPRQAAQWRMPRFIGWAAMACSVAVLAAIAYRYWPVQPGPGYVEIPLQGMEAVAIVTHAEDLGTQRKGGELKPGMRLKPGSMTLQQGRVQLEFLGGAKVLVQGPCELHILSPKSATLVSGKAATRVLEWGRGFVLNTPEAVMVDLGTEFAVEVDQQQGSNVQVVNGEVEVSVLGEDGSTLTSERVEEANGLRIRPGATTLETNTAAQPSPLKVLDDAPRPLSVPASYIRTVMRGRPVVYWRFESLENGLVPNEVGPQFAARLQLDSEGSSAIQVTEGHVDFAQADGPRYLITNEPVPNLNANSFSLEFWVNPAMLHWATLAAIVPEGDEKSARHLNVIELAHQTFLVHEAGAFRFMHRYPPTEKGGINLFTPGSTPGRWHHLVTVKTPQELKVYLNGQLSRRLTGEMGSDEAAYQLHLGALRVTGKERQFVGSLDEVALYPYALSDAEIERHYRLLIVGSGE